jgi:phosphoenolpyruvate synthase/pyruvate phosphate dikinase
MKSNSAEKPALNYFGNRDFGLAFCEAYLLFENTNHEWLEGRKAIGEYSVVEFKDGFMQVYFDPASLEWIKAELFKKLNEDNSFVQKIIKISWEYEKPLSEILKNPRALNQKELQDFMKKLHPLWSWLTAMWWLIEALEDKPNYKQYFGELMELRKKLDYFAPNINMIFAKTALEMYPYHNEYLNLISVHEMEHGKEISLQTLQDRKDHLFLDESGIYTGKKAKERMNVYTLLKPQAQGETEVKGKSTFKGKHVGRVTVVLSDADAKKVQEGDVLVASQTIPNWVFAMEKAGALVTDEGGLLSHAAILSRELKKPCVIGTKIATQVFKDGDVVEVDAEKGIVRIIK